MSRPTGFFYTTFPSCEFVALQENFVDRPESYDSFSAKSCIFLAHGLGYVSSFPYTIWPKARYTCIKFSYYSRIITNLTNIIWHRPEQPYKSHTWIFAYHLPYSRSRCFIMWQREINFVRLASNSTRVVGKCLTNFLIPCFGSGCVWEWRNISQTVSKKYTTFSVERIVALRSVNKFSRRATISQLNFPLCPPFIFSKQQLHLDLASINSPGKSYKTLPTNTYCVIHIHQRIRLT
jgi:hypothetical protein